jgi:hypothetical protein
MKSDEMYPLLHDPVVFSQWVRNVAAVHEQLSEAIRDAADVVAIIDPIVAIGLYQAADRASDNVHALRHTAPVPTPAAKKHVPFGWVVVGFILGAVVCLLR